MQLKKYMWPFLLLFGWTAESVFAQQMPHFSMSPVNKFQYNPAISAFENRLVLNGVHRDQWKAFPGAPSTQLINGYMPLDFGVSAVGFNFMNDRIGLEKTMAFSLSYAHRIETAYGPIALALQLGGEQKSIDQSRLRTPGGTYDEEVPDHNDPLLGNDQISSWAPVLGLSAWYAMGNMEFGLSVRQLSPTGHFSDDPLGYSIQPEVSLYGDYYYPLDGDWYVIPSLHIYTDFKQLQSLLHGKIGFQNQYFGGLGFRGLGSRNADAIVLMAGFRINENFTVYYNYDIGLSDIYRPSAQSHEFTITYRSAEWSSRRERPPVIYNPRFLE